MQRSIGKQLNTKRRGVVGKAEYDVLGDSTFQSIKRELTLRGPGSGGQKRVLARQRRKRRSNNGVPSHKLTEVVGKTQELAKLLDARRNGPVANGSDLTRVHVNAVGRDDVAKVLNMLLYPVALGKFGVKLVFAEDVQDHAEVLQMFLLGKSRCRPGSTRQTCRCKA